MGKSIAEKRLVFELAHLTMPHEPRESRVHLLMLLVNVDRVPVSTAKFAVGVFHVIGIVAGELIDEYVGYGWHDRALALPGSEFG